MSSTPEERPSSEPDLQSPEYRKRLMRKLNCLTAVLEVALAKVRRTLAGPDPDVERLTRIQRNLGDTLEVCRRAKRALERHEQLPEDLAGSLANVVGERIQANPQAATARKQGELSKDEARRFREMGPIDSGALRHVDLEDLARRLQGG
jgi:hypothetical protein